MLNVLAVQAPDHGTNYGYIVVIVVVLAIAAFGAQKLGAIENRRRAARKARK